jgi:heparinase II-like protein
MPEPVILTLRAKDAADLIAAGSRSLMVATMKRLLNGREGVTLGYDAGPDAKEPRYVFYAADVTASYQGEVKVARRFFVILPGVALLDFDVVVSPGTTQAVRWALEGADARVAHKAILHPGGDAGEDRLFLNALLAAPAEVAPIASLDLAGARIAQKAVLFYREAGMARSSVYFDLESKGQVSVLVAGLEPGYWEVWWNGYLEETGGEVKPQAGTLCFSGEAGSFFLRRRG